MLQRLVVHAETRLLQVVAQPCLPDLVPLWLDQPVVVQPRFACLSVGLGAEFEPSEPISSRHLHQRESLGLKRLLLSRPSPSNRFSDS